MPDPIPFGEPVSASTPMAGHVSMHPHHYMTPMVTIIAPMVMVTIKVISKVFFALFWGIEQRMKIHWLINFKGVVGTRFS